MSAILAIDLGKFNSVLCWLSGLLHRRAKELGFEVVKKPEPATPVLSA